MIGHAQIATAIRVHVLQLLDWKIERLDPEVHLFIVKFYNVLLTITMIIRHTLKTLTLQLNWMKMRIQ